MDELPPNSSELDTLLYDLLRFASGPSKEFDLLKHLQEAGLFDELAKTYQNQAQLLLFKQHFIIKNSLYRLQKTLWQSQIAYLQITLSDIELAPFPAQSSQTSLSQADQNLAEYYLDWANFDTSAAQVDDLLASFWQQFYCHEDAASAFATLDLKPDASWPEVKRRYKVLAQQHHPDKGGDVDAFVACRKAYQQLKALMSAS